MGSATCSNPAKAFAHGVRIDFADLAFSRIIIVFAFLHSGIISYWHVRQRGGGSHEGQIE